ncbi:MAG: efflux transporter outer membrane subunit [Planctomycetia bacterium]|nr:efflux transporter outer membrane subunit [Planctomycetia bacterium]
MEGGQGVNAGGAHAPRLLLRRLLAACLVSYLLLAAPGCSGLSHWLHNGFKVGPNYCPPSAPLAEEWIQQQDEKAVVAAPPEDFAWWGVFNDPALNGLIETAYRQNLDLAAAVTRIMEARARRSIAIGNLFPQSQSALAAYAHGQISRNLGLPFPGSLNFWADGFNASWELDVWGRLRRNIEASNANLDAAVEGYGNSLVMLLSEVATNYVQLRTFDQRLAYARENVEIQAKSLELVQVRFELGTASELDLRQAKASLAQTQATLLPLESGRQLASNQLCILLGMPVNDLARQLQPRPIPAAPLQIAVGIPADLLRKRPDIRRAERQVAAQSAQIGIAESDLYPRLAVTGFIGYAAQDFNGLFDAQNFTGFILPTLQWKILNYGRVVNNIRAQDALFENSVLQYQQTVLRAGREVEDALVQFVQTQRQARFLEQSVAESRRALEIVQEQFKGGTADFNRVYTIQAQVVDQQDQLAAVKGNVALYLIQAYKALGGGWEYFCQGYGLPTGEMFVAPIEELPRPAER